MVLVFILLNDQTQHLQNGSGYLCLLWAIKCLYRTLKKRQKTLLFQKKKKTHNPKNRWNTISPNNDCETVRLVQCFYIHHIYCVCYCICYLYPKQYRLLSYLTVTSPNFLLHTHIHTHSYTHTHIHTHTHTHTWVLTCFC